MALKETLLCCILPQQRNTTIYLRCNGFLLIYVHSSHFIFSTLCNILAIPSKHGFCIISIVRSNSSHCMESVQIRSFSGPYFPAVGVCEVSLCIQSECGKIRTRKNSVFGHISHTEPFDPFFKRVCDSPQCSY